jgi:DNA replication protein DnaC
MPNLPDLKERAKKIGLRAIVANWDKYIAESWLEPLIVAEEKEKDQRSLERRLREAAIGEFKPMADFDWKWPTKIDRDQIEELLTLEFLKDSSNVVLVSTNGLGKTMVAQNLANTALSRGLTTKFVKASHMLNQLLECDGAVARSRCLKKYCSPKLLVVDEVGYMNYDNSYADMLYEVVSSRYLKASTVITTNKGFKQWGEIFPNAGCVVTMVDRLLHKSEVVVIEGESYRHREAMEQASWKEQQRKARRKKKTDEPGKKEVGQ